jgi:hypothetical protein
MARPITRFIVALDDAVFDKARQGGMAGSAP